jgi:multiple sugar transport system ATP-binding protein
MAFLELRGVSKRYGIGSLVIPELDLSIEQGEFVVLLGPSGCGKTTTIRMISGLEEVSGGDILIDGHSVVGKEPRGRGVSMIFQSYALWPHMTVRQNIAYPLKLKKMPRHEIASRVQAAADSADIGALLDRFPGQMSGGQRQRVAVARAIVVQPKIFLMDEPLSNLDATLRGSMRTELKRIHREQGTTTILVTHDQSEAMSMADRIVVMNAGRIEQQGTPQHVYHDSATRFVASFIGTPPMNFFTGAVQDQSFVSGPLTVPAPSFLPRGRELELGVRPESLDVSNGFADRGITLGTTTVDFVEPQGSHSVIVSTLPDGGRLKSTTTENTTVAPGTTLPLWADREQLAWFDKESGARLA